MPATNTIALCPHNACECPVCGLAAPMNEMIAFGRHEDCWANSQKSSTPPRRPRAFKVALSDYSTGGGRRNPIQESRLVGVQETD